ncbi:hypothetical protein TWF481_001473 [Arthrobotrys musiformis]|uniref:BTB domain-containing protein n=1 Tax=Arthrobotrys musiformis TaxID=47236 RepID=A0AAV9WRN5_9PEZI
MNINPTAFDPPRICNGVRLGRSQGGQNVLSHVYQNPKYSDVTVYVGTEQKPFFLHRAIVAQNSQYFDDIFDSNIDAKHVYLPDIRLEIFVEIASWLYNQEYRLRTHQPSDIRETVGLYQSANILGISGLKKTILNQMSQILHRDIELRYSKPFEDDYFLLMEEFCTHSQASEEQSLTKCVGLFLQVLRLEPSEALEIYQEEEDSETIVGILKKLCESPQEAQ